MDVRDLGGAKVVELSGMLTLDRGDAELLRCVSGVVGEGARHVVVDLGGVTYIDSAGLTALISCYRKVKEVGGRIGLLRPNGHVMELLRVTRLDGVFEVHTDESKLD